MTDEELVEKYRQGDKSVFDELYSRYKKAIISYANSVYIIGADREDVIQDGTLGLLKAINYYNGKSSFKNFAFTCIRTSIFNGTKKYLSNKNLPLNIAVGIEDCDKEFTFVESAEEIMISKETFDTLIDKARQVLSKFELTVLERFLQGYSYSEIAKELGESPKTCDNALQRIKKKLSGEL